MKRSSRMSRNEKTIEIKRWDMAQFRTMETNEVAYRREPRFIP